MSDGTRGGSNAGLDVIATDDLTSGTFSGQKAQLVKLGVGAHNAMEEVDATHPLRVDPTGTTTQPVQAAGNVASGSADSGNPVKIGGKVSSGAGTIPNFSDLQRADFSLSSEGALLFAASTALTDGAAGFFGLYRKTANNASGVLGAANGLFNGTTWDRQRGNSDTTVLASASRTTTQTQADQTNYNNRGIAVVLSVTSAGTGSVTLTIQGKDVASGAYYTLLAGAAVTSNSTNRYTVFPGATVTANVSANDQLPRTFRVLVTANNANAVTYSVGYSLVV